MNILNLPWAPWRRTAAIPRGLLVPWIWAWVWFGGCLFVMVVAAPTILENADIVAGLLEDVPWEESRAFFVLGRGHLFLSRTSILIRVITRAQTGTSAKGRKRVVARFIWACYREQYVRENVWEALSIDQLSQGARSKQGKVAKLKTIEPAGNIYL